MDAADGVTMGAVRAEGIRAEKPHKFGWIGSSGADNKIHHDDDDARTKEEEFRSTVLPNVRT